MLNIPAGLSTTTTSRSKYAIALSGRAPGRSLGARSSTTTTAPGGTRRAEARQHVLRILPALDVEARHAVGQHRPGPRLAVLAGHRVVGRAPWRRHLPLRDALGPGIEHADG